MKKRSDDIYVLGTGLSHDGSACLLKNGRICVAVEKERITRTKHHGGNDVDAIRYCLAQEGIGLDDVDLVVQNANYGLFRNGNSWFGGADRLFNATVKVPVVTISHHMAHAYYALGTSPFEEAAIFVLDGCGSTFDDCLDKMPGAMMPEDIPKGLEHLYAEKDSLYLFRDNRLTTVHKDFSPWGLSVKRYLMHTNSTQHSIGGFYHGAAHYCFGDFAEIGKLMGLAPYGRPGVYDHPAFILQDGRAFVNYADWLFGFDSPVREKGDLYKNFQHYADVACWAQREIERAIEYVLRARRSLVDTDNLCYTGGVALNAVANGKLLQKGIFKNIYFTPAAGDNGVSIGCAYYGWLEVLKRERVRHNGNSCFGKTYGSAEIEKGISTCLPPGAENQRRFFELFFKHMPEYFDSGQATKVRFRMEFSIAGIGSIPVTIYRDRLETGVRDPDGYDALLSTDPETFAAAIGDSYMLLKAVRDGRSVMEGDAAYFLRTVRVQQLMEKITGIMNAGADAWRVKFEKRDDYIQTTVRYLAEGKVVAWFQGGCEFGPRALGNRSILADPRNKGIQKFINNKVKFREDFRPFAPVIMREHVSEYFHFCGDSPYMILVAKIVDEWKEKVPGVVHVDGSCRIQTVTTTSNARLYKLLKEWKVVTGLPMLLNTSFNGMGMPIVETPAQALAYFYACGLDCLVMDDYIITK